MRMNLMSICGPIGSVPRFESIVRYFAALIPPRIQTCYPILNCAVYRINHDGMAPGGSLLLAARSHCVDTGIDGGRSMRLHKSTCVVLVVGALLSAVASAAWSNAKKGDLTAKADGGKIPITTKSAEARKEFLLGRELSDRLLAQDSLQHFDKAIALDPGFASAELARANSSPTTKEFFDHQKKAMSFAGKVSEGEKLLILANDAGVNGDVVKQQEYLEKLVAAYPNDERAQFNLGTYYFGQQEFEHAIDHFKKSTALAPDYSPTYNILGYAYRQQGRFAEAELAFKKYIELIPNDPNPYDSYAELLLKMGRFTIRSRSIARRSRSIPTSLPLGSGFRQMRCIWLSRKKRGELQKMVDNARNDGERRTAFFGMAVVAADSGKLGDALHAMDKEYAVAEKEKRCGVNGRRSSG